MSDPDVVAGCFDIQVEAIDIPLTLAKVSKLLRDAHVTE